MGSTRHEELYCTKRIFRKPNNLPHLKYTHDEGYE
jgi:hypothetical protein